MMDSIKHRLELIRRSCLNAIEKIDYVLEKDNRIDIATFDSGNLSKELFRLMERMAEVSNPVLIKMGLSREAIQHDIEEYVNVLGGEEGEKHFASLDLNSKYSKNKSKLRVLKNWFERLISSIERIETFISTEAEEKELEGVFAKLDASSLSEKEREELKKEFLEALNRINRT